MITIPDNDKINMSSVITVIRFYHSFYYDIITRGIGSHFKEEVVGHESETIVL